MGKGNIYFIKELLNELLDIIFPPEDKCITCGDRNYNGLCLNCYNSIIRNKETKDYLCYGYYGKNLKKLILEFKYKKNFLAGEILGDFLLELIKEKQLKFDIITFVPLYKLKEQDRGFNQSKLIAKYLSRKVKKPYKSILIKVKENKEQKTLSKEERKLNVREVYSIKNEELVINKNILLIDDVITTGCTINECERILIESGAKNVIKIAIARAMI